MKLIPDWRVKLRKLWSIRLILLSAGLGALETALPVFTDKVPAGIFAVLSVVVGIAAAAARLVAQPKL